MSVTSVIPVQEEFPTAYPTMIVLRFHTDHGTYDSFGEAIDKF